MIGLHDLAQLLRAPRTYLQSSLDDPPSPQRLLVSTVLPLAAIRPAALVMRSILLKAALPGVVLGVGSFVLQIGTWLGIALVLPPLVRQFHAELSERQAFALTTYASLPMWLAGVLYAIPEEPAWLFIWSRVAVTCIALYGLLIAFEGLVVLGVRRSMRPPLLASFGIAALTVYGILFTALGIGANIVLFILG